mmetsp:Transcript_26901/g.45402  ORF Transcript_26901/g.45402 Transcript_26901/m.45402 type:complete len:277 (-) Transcript_26901:58-888(-)
MRDAHKILSISRNATMSEIKVAYRRLAMQLHPDTNGGDVAKSEQFKKVNAAYAYLTDPKSGEGDIFEDYEAYSTYRPNHHSAHSSHWNPFQSPYQNMKNAQNKKNNKNNHSHPFVNFDDWDDFDFIDMDTGEEVVFGFDKQGRARTSRKQAGGFKQGGGKSKSKNKSYKSKNVEDVFADFTTEEIEDIIRNSTSQSPGWGNDEYFGSKNRNRSRSRSQDSNNSNRSNRSNAKKKGNGGGGSKKKGADNDGGGGKRGSGKSTRSRRRRRGGDDCCVS